MPESGAGDVGASVPDPLVRHLATRFAGLLPAYPHVALAVGVSGGADSAALLHACAALARVEPALRLRAIHVNHGLQAAAAGLQAAATALAGREGVPLRVLRLALSPRAGDSPEAAAREARYAAVAAALEPDESFVTAQHLEDQAETVLLQLLRGAGMPGLAAMPALAALGAGRLVRPLLDVPRAELAARTAAHALPVHDDPMNADRRYERAYLRHEIWPLLVARWPAAARTLARGAGHLAEAQALSDAHAAADVAACARADALDVERLLALEPSRRNAALRRWLAARGLRVPPAHRLRLVERELLRARCGTGPRMAWDGGELRRYGGELHAFAPLAPLPSGAALGGREPLRLPGLGQLVLVPTLGEGLAQARVPLPLAVRARSGGERLAVAGTTGRRALKDLLREARVPPWARERLVVLWSAERAVAAVLPDRTWVADDVAARPGEPGWRLEWRDAPSALRAVH